MLNRRIVVTGATGLVGSAILQQYSTHPNIQPIPWFRTARNYPNEHIVGDLTDDSVWLEQLDKVKPDVLIHAAAQSHVDRCAEDDDYCYIINVDAIKRLVEKCNQLGVHLVFISSDFVFDGKANLFYEESDCKPVNLYGQTKMLAESHLKQYSKSWSIIRTILVYGVTGSLKRNNLLTWVVNSLKRQKQISVVNDQFRMPTYANDLAMGIVEVAQKKHRGIFHLSGGEGISVYDFAVKIARHYGLDESLITAMSSAELNEKNPRPQCTAFSLLKSQLILNYKPRSIEDCLEEIPMERITSLDL